MERLELMSKCMIQDCKSEAQMHLGGLEFCVKHALEIQKAIMDSWIRGILL